MKNSFTPITLALVLLSVPMLPAAEKKTASPAAATSPALAGRYAGKWKGDAEGAGDLRFNLKQEGAKWVLEAVFTFEGSDVPTTTKSVEVNGSAVTFVFSWKVQDVPGQSTLTGELSGDTLKGKYETTGADGSSTGTWSVTRA